MSTLNVFIHSVPIQPPPPQQPPAPLPMIKINPIKKNIPIEIPIMTSFPEEEEEEQPVRKSSTLSTIQAIEEERRREEEERERKEEELRRRVAEVSIYLNTLLKGSLDRKEEKRE